MLSFFTSYIGFFRQSSMWLRREGEASAKGHRECSQRVTAESARGEERAHDRWPPVTTAAVRGRKSWASHRRNVASFKAGHITVLRPRTPATRTPGQHGEKEKKKRNEWLGLFYKLAQTTPFSSTSMMMQTTLTRVPW